MELNGIGGILSYSTAGHGKACGQVVGANGAGDFCIIFIATPEAAAEMARQHVRKLERDGHREIVAIFTPNDDISGYHGNPVKVVTANARIEPGRAP